MSIEEKQNKTSETPRNLSARLAHYWRTIKKAVAGEEQDFTSGSIDGAIVLLAIPMILEMAMESLFAVVDIFFVSKIGDKAVATVGLTESVLTLVYSLGIGLSAASTAMVARRVGEGDREGAAHAGAQTIMIGVTISVLLAIPGFFFAKDLLLRMADDPSVAESGWRFTQIMFTANLPILLLWMLNGILRGAGDASTAMRALWIANIINIVLDPLLIFGVGPFPELGVMGAAVATTIGRSTGVAYQLWQLMKVGKIILIRPAHFRFAWDIVRRQLQLGAGTTGQYLIGSASWIFIMKTLAHLGTSVTAGYTIAIRLIIFTILPSWGMANAAATLVGQNLGAGKPERAEQSVWRTAFLNMLFMLFVGATYLIGAPFFIRLFTTDAAIVEAGSLALRIIAGGYVFFGYGMIMTQAINGAGDTKTPTLLNFVCFWLLQIPLAYGLAIGLGWGQTGAYTAIVISETVLAAWAVWVFRQGKWKTVKV